MIFGKYSIEKIDSTNIVIYESRIAEKGKSAGEECKSVIGYYTNLESACTRMLDYCAKEDVDDINTVIENIAKAKGEIIEALKGFK